jgi:hypothetical protein
VGVDLALSYALGLAGYQLSARAGLLTHQNTLIC